MFKLSIVSSYLSLVFSVFLGAVGQLSLKIGALNQVKSGSSFLFEKYTLIGLSLYFVAAIAYVYALRRVPLSIAFPSASFSYVFVSIAAHLFLGESFTNANVAALSLITAGVFILAFS
jgi:small multidrug resistance pump